MNRNGAGLPQEQHGPVSSGKVRKLVPVIDVAHGFRKRPGIGQNDFRVLPVLGTDGGFHLVEAPRHPNQGNRLNAVRMMLLRGFR